MLTADQITALGDKTQRITDPIVEFLIQDITRRVRQAGQLTSTASYQIWRLQNLGMSQQQVQEEIRKRLNLSLEQVEQLLTQSAEVGYNFDLKNLPHVDAVSFAENTAIQEIVSTGVKMAQDDLSNMVQTLGFVTQNGKAEPLTEAYRQVCDFAFQKVATGAQDYNSAIRQAVKGLAERGIVSIDYESGRSISMEAAVRRNVMSALGTMQAEISQRNHDDLGCDGWEISAHMASAPDHEPIQGKQFSDEAYTRLNNALVRRIGTLNCGHAAFPIILGINEPQYSPEELEQFRKANKDGIEYEGRHYTMYEATQHQRKLERAIRNRKRRILIDEALGDKEQLAVDQTRLVILNGEYARFTKAARLRSQRERASVAGFGTKEARDAKKAYAQRVAEVGEAAASQNWYTIPVAGGQTETKYRMIRRSSEYADDKNRIIDDNVRDTNPAFKKGPEYQQNCQRCVAAYEMRRRGYDVIAKPAVVDEKGELSAKDPLYRLWPNIFKNARFSHCRGSDGGKAEILRRMSFWGDGAVAEVCIQRDASHAHVFIAQNVGGKIRFIDPQTGSIDCSESFTKAQNGATIIARIDNLEATELVEKCIKNRGGKK